MMSMVPGTWKVPVIALILLVLPAAAGHAAATGPSSETASASMTEQARELLDERENGRAIDLLLEVIEKDDGNDEAHFLLARVYLRTQEHDEARQHAERAVALNDSVSEYHMWLARTYLARATESGFISAFRYAWKGKRSYERAVDLDSANVEARLELCMYLVAAPWLVGGNIGKGREQAMIVERQDSLYGSYARANVSERDGDLEAAETYLKRAVRLDTTSTFYSRYALGYFYERRGRFDEAAGVFRGILEDKPDEMTAVFQVGKICVITGSSLDEAEECFKRYLEAEIPPNAPRPAAAHWRLGMVYDLQGRHELAVEELRKAVELAPDNRVFRQTLKYTEKRLER